jgi:hypothetical protein
MAAEALEFLPVLWRPGQMSGEQEIINHLREVLHYDPDSGIFTWRYKNGDTREEKIWNTRYGGKRAGTIAPSGYLLIFTRRSSRRAHRLAFALMNGGFPKLSIDHINGDRLDNRWSNLREATKSLNAQNRHVRSEKNPYGVHGITYYDSVGKWRARIKVNGSEINLGYYDSVHDAVKARKNAELVYFHVQHREDK